MRRTRKISRDVEDAKRYVKAAVGTVTTDRFVLLCTKHLLVPTLDSVVRTSWLARDGCNVFLIGERHAPHTKCGSIRKMFEALFLDNSADPIEFDLILEYLQRDKERDSLEGQTQLTKAKQLFHTCIKHHNCDVRVHWGDPSITTHGLPKWLVDLARYDVRKGEWVDWTDNPAIARVLREKGDLVKILTENRVAMKEIAKAAKVNPQFTVEFAKQMFLYFCDLNQRWYAKESWRHVAVLGTRVIMDIYAVARIIKSRMKNVIFYGGDNHATRCITLLTALKFTKMLSVAGTCA